MKSLDQMKKRQRFNTEQDQILSFKIPNEWCSWEESSLLSDIVQRLPLTFKLKMWFKACNQDLSLIKDILSKVRNLSGIGLNNDEKIEGSDFLSKLFSHKENIISMKVQCNMPGPDDDDPSYYFMSSLPRMNNIKYLSLYLCETPEEYFWDLCKSLKEHKKCTHLSIKFDNISKIDYDYFQPKLSESLEALDSVHSLTLDFGSRVHPQMMASVIGIFESLGKMVQLTELKIYCDSF